MAALSAARGVRTMWSLRAGWHEMGVAAPAWSAAHRASVAGRPPNAPAWSRCSSFNIQEGSVREGKDIARKFGASHIRAGDVVGSVSAGELVATKAAKIKTCTEDQLVIDAIKTMVAANIGSLIVIRSENGVEKPVGIFTERDYLEKVAVLGRNSHSTKVREIMSAKGLVWVPPSATLNQCMDLMAARHVTHIPVIDGNQLKGLISIGDVVKNLVTSYKAQAHAMNEYIAGTY